MHALGQSLKLILASSLTLSLISACATPGTSTGIATNPCQAAYWQGTSYCAQSADSSARAARVTGISLNLAEIPQDMLSLGLRLPLRAQALFAPAYNLPANSIVSFRVDGRLIGSVTAHDTEALSAFFLQLSATLTAGEHLASAELSSPDGKVLATSNTIVFRVPQATDASKLTPAIALLTPLKPLLAGSPAHLQAELRLPDGVQATSVEFYSAGKLLGLGRLNPDGSYHLDAETSGLAPGIYPLTAVIRGANQQELARSQVAPLIISAPPLSNSSPSLSLLNLAGLDQLPIGQTLPLSGRLQFSNSLPAGSKIVFLADGQIIGEALVSASGHYRLDWPTSGFKPADYLLSARLRNSQGEDLAVSNAVPLRLTAATSQSQPGVTLADLPALASPGTLIPLRAAAQLPPNLRPEQARIEFTANGQVIGQGLLNPDGSWSLNWNTQGLPEGPYEIKALLYGPGGLLATSPIGTVRLSNTQAAAISLTSGSLSALPGSVVPLRAAVQASPEQLANGAYVELRSRGETLGRASQQSDGSWLFNWTTQGRSVGVYPIDAVLHAGNGSQLAVSNLAEVTLSAQPVSAITLTSGDLSAPINSIVPLTASIQIDSSLQNPRVLFLNQGQVLGSGLRQSDGSWRLDWNTSGLAAGNYPIQARLTDQQGQILADSPLGTVSLTVQTAQTSPTITLSRPLNGSKYSTGSMIPLEALITISEAGRQAGVSVSFTRDGAAAAVGLAAGSDRWQASWPASGFGPQTFKAQLRNARGELLAESQPATIEIFSTSSGSSVDRGAIELLQPGVTGLVALQGESVSLTARPRIPGYLASDTPFVEFLADGSIIGRGTPQADGTWTFVYNTSGRPAGPVIISARLASSGESNLATSNQGLLRIVINQIDLTTPADGSAFSLNAQTSLSARAELTPAQLASGYRIRFRSGATVIQDLVPVLDTGSSYIASLSNYNVGAVAGYPTLSAELIDSTNNVIASDSHTIGVYSATVVSPADNTSIVIGSQTPVTGTAGPVPTGGSVRFEIRDSANQLLTHLPASASGGNNYQATTAWNTAIAHLGTYRISTQILDLNGQLLTSSAPHTVLLLPANQNLNSPVTGTLHYRDRVQVPFSYTPRDSSNNPLTAAEMSGASVVFYNSLTNAVIGSGTRQADGSYTYSWNAGLENSGTITVAARVEAEASNLLTTNPRSLRLQLFSETLFGVNNASPFTLYSILKDTGELYSLGNLAGGGNALDKHPDTGEIYYIGSNSRVNIWNTATGTVSTLAQDSGTGYARFGMGKSGGQLIMFASTNNQLYRIDPLTGLRTAITVTGWTNSSNSGDLAITPDGIVYIAQDRNLLRVDFTGNLPATATSASIGATINLTPQLASNFSSFGFVSNSEARGVVNVSGANQLVKITGLPGSPVVTTIGGTYGFVVGDISSIH